MLYTTMYEKCIVSVLILGFPMDSEVIVPKTNLKTLAYNTIRQKIVNCEYTPGSYLNEEILTNQLNLSRTPVRDALGRLEQEGLVEIKAKKGVIVMPLSVNTINMIYEMRNLYEPYILTTYGNMIPAERLREFYSIFIQQDLDSERFQDNAYLYEVDFSFHAMLVGSCPNGYIQRSYAMIQTQNERFRHMTGNKFGNRLRDTFEEHLAIIRPCLEGNWEAAAEGMRYHLEQSKKASFRLIFDSLDQQTVSTISL